MSKLYNFLEANNCKIFSRILRKQRYKSSVIFVSTDDVFNSLSKLIYMTLKQFLASPVLDDILLNHFGHIEDQFVALNHNKFAINDEYIDDNPEFKVLLMRDIDHTDIYIVNGLLMTETQRVKIFTNEVIDKFDTVALTAILSKQQPKDTLNFCNTNSNIRRLCHTYNIGKYLLELHYPDAVLTNDPYKQFEAITHGVETHYRIETKVNYKINFPYFGNLSIKPLKFVKSVPPQQIPGWSSENMHKLAKDHYNRGTITKDVIDDGKPEQYKTRIVIINDGTGNGNDIKMTFNVLGLAIPSGTKLWVSFEARLSSAIIKVFKNKSQAINFYLDETYIDDLLILLDEAVGEGRSQLFTNKEDMYNEITVENTPTIFNSSDFQNKIDNDELFNNYLKDQREYTIPFTRKVRYDYIFRHESILSTLDHQLQFGVREIEF